MSEYRTALTLYLTDLTDQLTISLSESLTPQLRLTDALLIEWALLRGTGGTLMTNKDSSDGSGGSIVRAAPVSSGPGHGPCVRSPFAAAAMGTCEPVPLPHPSTYLVSRACRTLLVSWQFKAKSAEFVFASTLGGH